MIKASYLKLRQSAIDLLGGKCQGCGTLDGLQLHHRYYAKDSVRPKVHRECGNQTVKRIREAISHPERFSLLCLPCHNSKDIRRKPIVCISSLFEKAGVR